MTRPTHMAREVIERFDEGVFDDGMTSQNEEEETNSVVMADSDEDEIEHFDSTDSITVPIENQIQRSNDDSIPTQNSRDNSNNRSVAGQSVNNLGLNQSFSSRVQFSFLTSDFSLQICTKMKFMIIFNLTIHQSQTIVKTMHRICPAKRNFVEYE